MVWLFDGADSRRVRPITRAALTALIIGASCTFTVVATSTASGAASFTGQAVINYASAETGYHYCFDGGTPSGPSVGITDPNPDPGYYSNCSQLPAIGFDCTGLTLYAVYQASGGSITLSHNSSQATSALNVGGQLVSSTGGLQPGDLVYFDRNASHGIGDIDHVGIYTGGGNVLSAISEKWGIATHPIAWYESGGLSFVGGVRLWSTPRSVPTTLGALRSSGLLQAKSGIGGGWISEQGAVQSFSVASDPTNGVTIGEIDDSGNFWAKSGLGGGWIDEQGDVKAIAIASDASNGVTIGELDASGNFWAKSGIGGGWIDEQGDVRAIAIASDSTNGVTIGEIDDSGNFWAKSGIGGGWILEGGNVKEIAIASDPTNGVTIGELDSSGTFWAKSGIGGGWIAEQGDVKAIAIASDASNGVTIGELDASGNFWAKSGIGGGWIDEQGDVRAIAIASDSTNGVTIGEIDDSGNFWAKSGIGGGWIDEQGDVKAMSTGTGSSLRIPDLPTGVTAIAGRGQATVEFSAPQFDGGSAVTSYVITSSPGGLTATGMGSPVVVRGLAPGTPYSFRVSAVNAAGVSLQSAATASVTPMRIVTATHVTASPTRTVHGSRIALRATVRSGSGSPDGRVLFFVNGTIVCQSPLSNGVASCSTTHSPVGSDTVRATYQGSSRYMPSSTTSSIVVVRRS